MAKASAHKRSVDRYRSRMRKAGFRLLQLWVPDTRAPSFAAECRRQSRVAASNRDVENDAMTWIEASHDTKGWT